MRIQTLATATTTLVVVAVTAAPAMAGWLSSSDPSDSTRAVLRVDDSPKVSRSGWSVRWRVQITCPRGERIYGRVQVAERDPESIPLLAGEDQGITATKELNGGERCTGRRKTLNLKLKVADTPVVFDPSTGANLFLHKRIHRTPSNRTSAAVLLFSSEDTTGRGFFVQYCAAPNCASESGPRVTLR